MNLGDMIFETKIIEKRLLPVVQAPHHGTFPRVLFLRGNHRRLMKTTIFRISAPIKCTGVALSTAGLDHQHSKNLHRAGLGDALRDACATPDQIDWAVE